MNIEEVQKGVRQELFELQDLKYRDFHAKLIPTMEKKNYWSQNTCASRIC